MARPVLNYWPDISIEEFSVGSQPSLIEEEEEEREIKKGKVRTSIRPRRRSTMQSCDTSDPAIRNIATASSRRFIRK